MIFQQDPFKKMLFTIIYHHPWQELADKNKESTQKKDSFFSLHLPPHVEEVCVQSVDIYDQACDKSNLECCFLFFLQFSLVTKS